MSNKHKYLRLYITNYNFAMQDELHDKKMFKILKKIPEVKMTNLYAIVQTDKMSVDLNTVEINKHYELSCGLIINQDRKQVKFNLLKYYYEEIENKNEVTFKEFVEELENRLLSIDPFKSENIRRENLYKYIKIVDDKSYNEKLSIKCPFYWAQSDRKNNYVILNMYRVLNHFKIDILNDLEIIYIGKSMNSTMDRLKEHNKWSAVLAKDKVNPNANYDYLVYVFNFDKSETVTSDINNPDIILINYESDYDLEKLVKNLEIAFISHYIPLLNSDHTETIFTETEFVKKELLKLGYTHLMIEFIINEDSIMGQIKTPKAKSQTVEINIRL